MAKIRVKYGQNISDMAIQLYGSIEYSFKILADNPTITNLHSDIVGMDLVYDDTYIGMYSSRFKLINAVITSSTNGYSGSFDLSFDLSFD